MTPMHEATPAAAAIVFAIAALIFGGRARRSRMQATRDLILGSPGGVGDQPGRVLHYRVEK